MFKESVYANKENGLKDAHLGGSGKYHELRQKCQSREFGRKLTHRIQRRESNGRDVVLESEASKETPSCFSVALLT